MPNSHHQRAWVLFQQRRYSHAAKELRAGLTEPGSDDNSYALLALCLVNTGEVEAAATEAQRAISHSPESSFSHYAMAHVCLRQGDLSRAEISATEAVRLSTTDADCLALLAKIYLEQDRPLEALESTGSALAADPDHAMSLVLRATALTVLGRRNEAVATVHRALAARPEDGLTRANQGWIHLHQEKYPEALESFREALRLQPDLDWARQGMLTALKARYMIYRWMLKYFSVMSRLNAWSRWAIVIGLFVVTQALNVAGIASQIHLPAVLLFAAYGLLVASFWTIDPLSDLLMRTSPYGRYLLSPAQRRASTFAGCLIAAVSAATLAAIFMKPATLLFIAVSFALLLILACIVFRLPKGWQRIVAGLFVVVAGLMVIGAATLSSLDSGVEILLVSVIVATGIFRFLTPWGRPK